MIPNSEWTNQFECHFDPALKNYNRELYDFYTAKVEELGLKRVTEINAPCFLFFSDPAYIKQFDLSDIFLVQISGPVIEMACCESEQLDAFQLSSVNEWDDLSNMMIMCIDLWINHQCELVYQQARPELKKIMSLTEKRIDETSELITLKNELMKTLELEDMCRAFNNSVIAQKYGLEVKKLSAVIISLKSKCDQNVEKKHLPFYFGKHDDLVLEIRDTSLQIIHPIFWLLNESAFRFYLLEESQSTRQAWEKVFSLIETPLAIIDDSQHLVIHNTEFVNLGLPQRKCLELSDNEQVQTETDLFRIRKKNIKVGASNFTLINFIPVEGPLILTNTSAEELGIVSSSLAHELNNPLAGILAALTVLEMDELNEEVTVRIEEMKNGVNRCKQLVETFLGFSRAEAKCPGDQSSSLSIQRSFDQALELMRFRMIENNLKFSMDYQRDQAFIVPFNSSILSMLFYLILGEVVTSFSHYALVADSKLDVIKIVVKEKSSSLFIEWEDSFSLSGNFSKSKLIQHLVESQGAKIDFSHGVVFSF